MVKISVIGICGNSIFMDVNHFHEKGETLIADSVYEEVGGKGINQAIAARRMGAEVSFLTAVGNDENGERCKKAALENDINGHFKIKDGKITPFAVILTDKSGENRVTEYGTTELDKNDVLSFESEIASSNILLLQQEVSVEVNETAVQIANKHNVKVILNPAPIREISDYIAKSVYMVTPNEQEKKAIDIKRFANCITTLGKDGCSINDEIVIPALKVKAVNTTGAGDTFNGVLAACIANDMNFTDAAKCAVVASGISVSKDYVLSAIPYKREIEVKIRECEKI